VHITLVLVELHWLPVTARIAFKLALLTFKMLSSHQSSLPPRSTPAAQAVTAVEVLQS